jgi:uncharacterized protein
MYVNILKSYREVVAICDSDILGKVFEEGKKQLFLKESFYKGEEKSSEEVKKIMKNLSMEDATFNLAGEKTIELALKTKILGKKEIKTVAGIPYALILL